MKTHATSPETAATQWLMGRLMKIDRVGTLRKFNLRMRGPRGGWIWRVKVPDPWIGRSRFEIRASYSSRFAYPLEIALPTKSLQPPPYKDHVTKTLMGGSENWGYRTAIVVVQNPVEMGVLVGAMPIWIYLRRTQQVDGYATRPQANLAAIKWLAQFRRERLSRKCGHSP